MTFTQKALKVFGLLSVVAGLDLLVSLIVLASSGTLGDPLVFVAIGVTCAASVAAGALAVRAAHVLSRAVALLPVVLVVLLINIVNLLVCCLANVAVVSAVMNALFAAGIAYCARRAVRERMG